MMVKERPFKTKGGPILELLRTASRYFHQDTKRSEVHIYNMTHFAIKVHIFFMVGLLYVYYVIPFPRRYI